MAFQYNPGGGTHYSHRAYPSYRSNIISHGFDPSGCSYETDGPDCIDSGLSEDLTSFEAASAASAAQTDARSLIYRGGLSRRPETLDNCTEQMKWISLVGGEQEHSSTISRDSGFFSPESSILSAELNFDKSVNHSCNVSAVDYNNCENGFYLPAYIDEDGDTHLHTAVVQKREDVVSELLQCLLPPGYVNFRDSQYRTALHLAVLSDQPEMLKDLLKAGANPFSRDLNGETPLHIACASGFITCVKTLVTLITFFNRSSVIEPDVKNYKGFSCLHLAAANGHCEIVSFMIRHFNADVNVGDGCSGRTVLHHAADAGDARMVQFLLQEFSHCLNVHAVAHDKRTTPLALAEGRGFGDIAEWLERAGARHTCSCEDDMVTDSDDDL